MALRIAPSAGFLQAFLPIAHAATLRPITRRPLLQQLQPFLLPAITIPIPGIISEIWDSVLRAVPKKKTSHMKKRHRQMAGKALKDVTALNTCSGCGRQKRAHILCVYCVASVQRWFSTDLKPRDTDALDVIEPPTKGAAIAEPKEETKAKGS